MWLVRRFRKSTGGLDLARAAFVCVAALSVLLARSTPQSFPRFSSPSSSHTSITRALNSQNDPSHRQSFDREDSQWATFETRKLSDPSPVFSPHATSSLELFVGLVTDGFHYNRPPPTS